MTKPTWLILIIILVIAIFSPIAYWYYSYPRESEVPLFFGVTFGGKTASEAKLLIDKVKGYTNFFLVDSWDITTNETALNEVCDYTAKANIKFMVFFSFVSRVIYPWHQTWLDTAKAQWGENFLGVYLFDEPGGHQIDTGEWNEDMEPFFKNASSYSDASTIFVDTISTINSTLDLKRRGIPMFTSDYALYWFDYLAGYDTVFTELAWNHTESQQIGLCRGAANVQGKEWGAIITWTYDTPPYLASGPGILEDMLTAYEAGAKYVIVFNYYAVNSENNTYSTLTDEHFTAMQQFWKHVHEQPGDYGKVQANVAFVLPKDYGWGMRREDDSIWGLWPADNLSSVIWDKMNTLTERYGLQLDIVYDDSRFSFAKYSKVYYWNSTITLN
jgi:hypothetical protein